MLWASFAIFFLLTWKGPYLDMNRQEHIFLNFKFLDKRLVPFDAHLYDEISYFYFIKILKNKCWIFEKKRQKHKNFDGYLNFIRPLKVFNEYIYKFSTKNFFRLSQADTFKIDFSIFVISNVFNTNYTWFCASRLWTFSKKKIRAGQSDAGTFHNKSFKKN